MLGCCFGCFDRLALKKLHQIDSCRQQTVDEMLDGPDGAGDTTSKLEEQLRAFDKVGLWDRRWLGGCGDMQIGVNERYCSCTPLYLKDWRVFDTRDGLHVMHVFWVPGECNRARLYRLLLGVSGKSCEPKERWDREAEKWMD